MDITLIQYTVVGYSKETLFIITAYYPDKKKWSEDYRSRKENKE